MALTHDERFDRLEKIVGIIAEDQLSLQKIVADLATETRRMAEQFEEMNRRTDERFRETDRRFKETDQRISDLVRAIGEFIRRSTPPA